MEVGSHTVFKDNTLYFGVRFLPGIMEKFECKVAEFLNIFPEITDKTLNINAVIVHEFLNIIYVTEWMVTMADLEKELLYSRRHLLRILKDFMGVDIKNSAGL